LFHYLLKIFSTTQFFPLECESFSFKVNFGFLGHFYSSALSETKLDLSIYYPKFDYTLSTQLAKISWVDWVSSVAGVLGLFLGVSFFSPIEILTIVSELLGGLKKKQKRNHNRKRKPN
jgi:hypothetical protein